MEEGPPTTEANKITFHGRSSTAGLVEATRRFKFLHLQESMKMDGVVEQSEPHLNGEAPLSAPCASPSDKGSSKSDTKVKVEGPENSVVAVTRRPQFWRTPPVRISLPRRLNILTDKIC